MFTAKETTAIKKDRTTKIKETDKKAVIITPTTNEPSRKSDASTINEKDSGNVVEQQTKSIETTMANETSDLKSSSSNMNAQLNENKQQDALTKETDKPMDGTRKQSIVTVADVHTPSESLEMKSTESGAMNEIKTTEIERQAESQSQAKNEAQQDVSGPKSDISTTKKVETNIGNEKKPNESKPQNAEQTEKSNDNQKSTVTDEKVVVAATEEESKKAQKIETDSKIDDKKGENVNVDDTKQSMNDKENKEKSNDDATAKTTSQPDKMPTSVDDQQKQSSDASKSFQVLPNDETNKPSDNNQTQVNADTGNLEAPTEVIRKTSFTVLKSDESIDDLLLGVGMDDNNQNKNDENVVNGRKHSVTRPKSFKILNPHGASGEDIILQQSSDQETGGMENDDDYLNGNLATQRSGKYSDSELMKIDGQLNGRRKKYKKRAKSVKQLTIADGGAQNKDQDSGFEPSPRTLRSQKAATIRTIYTANLPERPRVGDIVDGRSSSSRIMDQHRKPGDKNAVNMATVSQTLQRNIRRCVKCIFSLKEYKVVLKSRQLKRGCCSIFIRYIHYHFQIDITWNIRYFSIY